MKGIKQSYRGTSQGEQRRRGYAPGPQEYYDPTEKFLSPGFLENSFYVNAFGEEAARACNGRSRRRAEGN